MEIQIKRAVKAGNSSAVILPRAWLNKEVRVELIKKDHKIILSEVIHILTKYLDLSNVISIYLTGSYARGDESKDSDIDILVITKDHGREAIQEGMYNILLVSEKLLQQKLKSDLLPIGQMIKEGKPLLNSKFLENIKIKVTKDNVKWYLNTTEDKLRIIEKALQNNKTKTSKISDSLAYTLVLRIRTLYIIKKLIESKSYFKKDFIQIIKSISKSDNPYKSYLTIKQDEKDNYQTSLNEVERLYKYLKKQLSEIKGLIKQKSSQ